MRLIVARHGETVEGRNGILLGQLPGRLSPLGFDQATRLALRLKDEPVRIIASSDLARAKETAEIVAKYHPNAIFEVTDKLRERGLGVFEGKPKAETAWVEIRKRGVAPERGETLDELYNRATAIIAALTKDLQIRTIVSVAHCDINLAITAALTGKPASAILTMDLQPNAAVSIFEIASGVPVKVVALNDVSHLS